MVLSLVVLFTTELGSESSSRNMPSHMPTTHVSRMATKREGPANSKNLDRPFLWAAAKKACHTPREIVLVIIPPPKEENVVLMISSVTKRNSRLPRIRKTADMGNGNVITKTNFGGAEEGK